MRWPFHAWGADVVLAGHNHVYERLNVDGGLYIVNGLGGGARYAFSETPEPGSQVRYQANHGALRVQASETTITFEFFNVEGELIDHFSLPADAPPAPPLPETVTTLPAPGTAQWVPLAAAFTRPVLLTHAGDGSGRLFVVEQAGMIRVVENGSLLAHPFLDIRTRVGSEANEQGLLGLAFHPQYPQNGYFYVNYTDKSGDTVIARFRASADRNLADPGTESRLLYVPQPFGNHNGGGLAFGPDGYLYLGLGDGGAANDPAENAQNVQILLGKLLRLDVDAPPPYIPPGNPFGAPARPEIWAYGLRNPWRFSFDPLTGDLYLGDVGQNLWEEIDFLPAGTPGGTNFGWDYLEGTHSFEPPVPEGVAVAAPVWEYSHAGVHCSVTGGVVYRGGALPDWYGVYVYGDFCSGNVWGLVRGADGAWQNGLLFQTGRNISSFGVDEAGEVYLVDLQGGIFRLEAGR